MRRWLVLALSMLGGCASPLTGLYCAEGYTQCGDECVDLDNDLLHCGACDNACPASGWVCIGGRCGQSLPGGGVDFDASVPPDGAVVDGGPDGSPREGGLDGGDTPMPVPMPNKPICDGTLPADECRCEVGTLQCDNVCVNPAADPQNCGGCGMECAEDQFCAAGTCVDECVDPFVRCGNACFDLSVSIDHCGQCGNACTTRICRDGMCAGSGAGHLVVVGHDYRASNVEQRKIAPAAVLLNNNFNPRILGFTDHTDPVVEERINVTLFDGLGIQPEDIDSVLLPALSLQLAEYDVLIIYPQTEVSQADLESKVMAPMEGVLPSFLERGGVIVVFEGGDDGNDGTWQLATLDGLTTIDGLRSISGEAIVKTQQGFRDFTSGVISPYRAERRSFGFTGVEPGDPGVLLFAEGEELPVVIHNVYAAP